MRTGWRSPTTILVLFILSAIVTVSMCTERTYVFGVNLALDPTNEQSSQYLGEQLGSLMGYEIWRDWWNALPAAQRTTKWGEVIRVELHVTRFSDYQYGGWQFQALCDTYDEMINNHSIDFIFGTTAWSGYALRNYTYYASGLELMVSPGDSSENYYGIPGSFGSPTANIQVVSSWLPYLRVSKAETIAVLSIYDGIYQDQMCQGVVDQAPLNNIKVIYHNNEMPFDWWGLGKIEGNDASIVAWTAALDQIRALNPDAVLVCDYSYGGEFALKYMREHDWTPKSVALSPITRPFTDNSLLDFVIVPASFSELARYPIQVGFTDSPGFDALVHQRYGVPATSVISLTTVAGMMYTDALVNAASNKTSDIIIALQLSHLPTFMGTSTVDVYRRQTRSTLVTQQLNSGTTVNIIGPAQAAVSNIIYPMPTWKERVFAPKWGSGVEIAATVLVLIGSCIAIAWLVFLILHWNHQVITAASPTFCVGIIVSSLVVYGSVFTWMPNLVNNSTCAMRVWLLPIGFMTMFGTLLSKTHRVVRLYFMKSVKIIRISNLEVSLIILAIVVGQAFISILSITIPKPKAEIKQVDPYQISKNFWTCTYPQSLKIISAINMAYGGLLLGWGIYLAIRVMKVPLSLYDESKVIGFAIYNTGFFAALTIGIQLALGNSNRNLTFMITAIACFCGATITTCVLMGTKLRSIYWPSSFSTSRNSADSNNTYGSSAPRNGYSTSNSHSSEKLEAPLSHKSKQSASTDKSSPPKSTKARRNHSTSNKTIVELQRTVAELSDQVQYLSQQLEEKEQTITQLITGAHNSDSDSDSSSVTPQDQHI